MADYLTAKKKIKCPDSMSISFGVTVYVGFVFG